MLCIKCNSHPVYSKKYLLCGRCYGQRMSKSIRGKRSKIAVVSEVEFAKRYFTHKNWICQPATFRLNINTTYRPDFYDGVRNVFIEVSSCLGAFTQSYIKVSKVRQVFPAIKFEFRNILGELIDENEPDKYFHYISASDM